MCTRGSNRALLGAPSTSPLGIMKRLLFAVLCLFFTLAGAQEGWIDPKGHAVPDTPAQKSVHGFGGWLLVTSDADWEAKWNAPSETTPHFAEAKEVPRGRRIFVLIFLANPQLTADGTVDVTCDIDVTRPNGTTSTHDTDTVCFRGTLKGDPHHTYLSDPVIGFAGDPGDPVGEWQVRVILKDNVRHVSIPLRTSFVLLDQ